MDKETQKIYRRLTPVSKKIREAKTMKTLHKYQKIYDTIYKQYLDSKKRSLKA